MTVNGAIDRGQVQTFSYGMMNIDRRAIAAIQAR